MRITIDLGHESWRASKSWPKCCTPMPVAAWRCRAHTSESEPSFFRPRLIAGRSGHPTFFSIASHLPLRRPTPLTSPFLLFPSSLPWKRESGEGTPLNFSARLRQRKIGDLPIPKFVELVCVEPVETSKRTPRLPRPSYPAPSPSTLRQTQRRGPMTPSPGSSPGQILTLSRWSLSLRCLELAVS